MQDEETKGAASEASEGTEVGISPETTAGEGEAAKPEAAEAKEEAKTFTQEMVDDIVQKRLERERNAFYKKLGVESKDEIDILVGKAMYAEDAKAKLDEANAKLAAMSEKMAFITNNVNPAREDDIRAHFKGKGIEFSEEALSSELATHPEWLNVKEADQSPKTTIQSLGVERGGSIHPETPEEKRLRIFGI